LIISKRLAADHEAFEILMMTSLNQWRSKGGGARGGTRPGAQALGAQQHIFCSHFKRVFKQKFSQSVLKNAYFWEKL